MRDDSFVLFVNGMLMGGLALHENLHGARFLWEESTAPIYRLYSIGDVHPGMFEVTEGGVSVAGELYRVPPDVWCRVEDGEPAGLYRGPVRLLDGGQVLGILYPRELAESEHRDISRHGGWREYIRWRDSTGPARSTG
jgi:AGZA family xanthine/uracil permease-like MFS transporter